MQNNNSLAIGILTWNAPKTLENTLRSYERAGLLAYVTEKLIFLQENNVEKRKIAEKYGLTIYFSEENIGISEAYKKLLEKSSCEYFLFLENDWVCIENRETTKERLNSAISLLESGDIDCVRLRHKYQYGEPLHSRNAYEGQELKGVTHLLDSIHWIEDPSLQFPTYLKKITLNAEDWFISSAANANYTNNPCVYKLSFIKKIFTQPYKMALTDEEKQSKLNYAISKRVSLEAIALEGDISKWWSFQKFPVAQGIGLFKHNPLNVSIDCPSIIARIKNKIKKNFLTSQKNKKQGKNIAFICAHRETDTWSTPISIMNEFSRLGWSVKVYTLFDENDRYIETNIGLLVNDIKSNKFVPDIVFHMDYTGFRSRYFKKIKKLGIFSVFEAADDPRCFAGNKKKIKDFSLILSSDYQSVEKYKKLDAHALWWPHFVDTKVQFPIDVEAKPFATCTRGENSSVFLDTIAQKMPKHFINKRGLYGIEYSNFMASGVIVLQNSRDKEITRRLFEGMAVQRLVLADRLPTSTMIDKIFEENKEIVYYDSLKDCMEKIAYYTSEQGISKAQTIAQAGYNKVVSKHTQKQRVETIINEYLIWLKN